MTIESTRTITIAYSPDSDDGLMIHALKQGYIEHPQYRFKFVAADIQQLNLAAHRELYDITAISVAALPEISDSYELMPVGGSVGMRYGPAVVVDQKSPIKTLGELAGKKIAVPGLQTSAFFAAKILLPEFRPEVHLSFDIGPRVMDHSVDAGILIHEMQIDYERYGMRRIADLGVLWYEKFELPLPLGAIAIRRALGKRHIRELTYIYHQSIFWGVNNKKEILDLAQNDPSPVLSNELAEQYISMYVNGHSLTLDNEVRRAIGTLLDRGAELGLCKAHQNSWLSEVGASG